MCDARKCEAVAEYAQKALKPLAGVAFAFLPTTSFE